MNMIFEILMRAIFGDRAKRIMKPIAAMIVVATFIPQAWAYQIPAINNVGSWTGVQVATGAGNQVNATKDTVSNLRTTVSVTGNSGGSISQGILARNNTTLLMSSNTTVPFLPAAANGLQLITIFNSCQTSFSTSLTCPNLGTVTIAFTDSAGNPVSVRNPKLHISRMGGFISTGVATLETATYTLTTPGVTLDAPAAGSVNLTVNGGNQFQANLGTMAPASAGTCPNAGCGTIPVTGTVSQLTFDIAAVRNNTATAWNAAANNGDAIYITPGFDEDFGDAPNGYEGGGTAASHILSSVTLGASVTADNATTINGSATGTGLLTASPNAGATATGDSDDALASFPDITIGTSATVTVPVSGVPATGAKLCGWVDANINGTFDTTERVCTTIASGATTASLTFAIPLSATSGATYARLRIVNTSTTADLNPNGLLSSGEVEDYQLNLLSSSDMSPAFGTLPAAFGPGEVVTGLTLT